MTAKDLKTILNGMNDDDEIVFELDYEDSDHANLSLTLAMNTEVTLGDIKEPVYMDVSKVTNYYYDEEFHPVISLKYSESSHTELLPSDEFTKVLKALGDINWEE